VTLAWPAFPAQINERAARLVAGAVAVSLVAAALTHTAWLVPALALGFVLRCGWGPRLSPLARLATLLAPRLWTVRLVPGSPKRFAQGVGATSLLAATALLAAGWPAAGWALAGLVAVFATLEATLAFCMGCWIYARLPRRTGAEPACDRCQVLH
jgi:hypothetical protein